MKKILVLEDEASIRSFIVINLRRAGYDVIEAETGEEALERLRALYGERGVWVRPAAMWSEPADRDGYHGPRFQWIGGASEEV